MEILIKDQSISIKYQVFETYYDRNRRPVSIPVDTQRQAVGLGDFAEDPDNPTPCEIKAFRKKVDELSVEIYGKPLAKAIADMAIAVST